MSSCCTPTGCTTDQQAATDLCPSCGNKGLSVDQVTLKALLTAGGLRRGVPPSPRFCSTPLCSIVYFDNAVPVQFSESDVLVPVHSKHPDDQAVPVCYCFGHTPEAIRDEIMRTGASSTTKNVSAEVKAGHCACEVRNPKGACCLGDLSRVELEASAAMGLTTTA